jgi:hypothetical protein
LRTRSEGVPMASTRQKTHSANDTTPRRSSILITPESLAEQGGVRLTNRVVDSKA